MYSICDCICNYSKVHGMNNILLVRLKSSTLQKISLNLECFYMRTYFSLSGSYIFGYLNAKFQRVHVGS